MLYRLTVFTTLAILASAASERTGSLGDRAGSLGKRKRRVLPPSPKASGPTYETVSMPGRDKLASEIKYTQNSISPVFTTKKGEEPITLANTLGDIFGLIEKKIELQFGWKKVADEVVYQSISEMNLNEIITEALGVQLPPIILVEVEGKASPETVSLDNRRLFIYKLLADVTGVKNFKPPQVHIREVSTSKTTFTIDEAKEISKIVAKHPISRMSHSIDVRNGGGNSKMTHLRDAVFDMRVVLLDCILERSPREMVAKCRRWSDALEDRITSTQIEDEDAEYRRMMNPNFACDLEANRYSGQPSSPLKKRRKLLSKMH